MRAKVRCIPNASVSLQAERQQFSGATFGQPQHARHVQPGHADTQRVVRAGRVRRHAAADRIARGAGGVSALPARGGLSHADLERGGCRGAGGLAARPDRSDAGHHQGPGAAVEPGAAAFRTGRRLAGRRADPGGPACADPRDFAAVAEAVGTDAQSAHRARRPVAQPRGGGKIRSGQHASAAGPAGQPAVAARGTAAGRACGGGAAPCGIRRHRRGDRESVAAVHHHGRAWHGGDRLHQHVRARHRRVEHRGRHRADAVRRRHAAAQETRGRRRLRADRGAVSRHGHQGVPERRRHAACAAGGCRCPGRAGRRRTLGIREP